MIPILYESTETEFNNNGLGRLRDCINCIVAEERNGVYECDFEYPVTADDFNDIRIGRIIGVTHDDSDDIQPFDIVSYEKPIDGVVTFHAVHISYRQSYLTVRGKNINSLADAFARLSEYATPTNPFTYQTDKTSTGYVGAFNGIPQTVRSMLGGVEGSILDAYGGEYEWDRFNVILHSRRGADRDFSIRYGVNMLDYNEELDSSGTYMACVPYWTDGTLTVVGDKQTASGTTITNRGECIPLDVSDKFESKPTKSAVNQMGKSVMEAQNPTIPSQNIKVEFVRLQDLGYEGFENLLKCGLCDTVNVVFPNYNTQSRFKIVKTVWDVLSDRYESMELGDLSVTLAEALGISDSQNGKATRSYFYANSVTATTISSTSTPTKVPITGIVAASGFEYDSTNKGIKCTEAGTYMITAQVPFNPSTSGDIMGLAIHKNGAQTIGPVYDRSGGSSDTVAIVPSLIVLAEGDYLTLYVRNNTASRGQTQTACRFSAWKVD